MKNEILFLSNTPQQDAETTITLNLVSDEDVIRGELLKEKQLEGKVTFNPRSMRIFFIPSSNTPQSHTTMVPDRTKWDMYLVWIPFTLHPTTGNAYYQKVTFFITLADQDVTAFDLFPRNITTQSTKANSYTLSPQLKFQAIEHGQVSLQGEIRLDSIQPTIRAFGEGDNTFYWQYTGSERQKGVIPETKHALLILQVPHGKQAVHGTLSYEVTVARKRLGRFKSKDCDPVSTPISWQLSETKPLYAPESVHTGSPATLASNIAPTNTRTMSSHQYFDICVVCALAEEARAFLKATSLYGATFQQSVSTAKRREYRHTTIYNTRGEPLTLLLSWQPGYGPEETILHLGPILEEFKPRFAIMTGICAGDKRKVKLGDIILAERAFTYDNGKFEHGIDGRLEYLHDIRSYHPHPEVLQYARMFDNWKSTLQDLTRPPSRHQQRDWLLCKLLDEQTPSIETIAPTQLTQFAPDWRKILPELQTGPQPYITPQRTLFDKLRVAALYYGLEEFPFRDRPEPELHIAPIASGSAVRADNPFDTIRLPVRGTIAIDMEGEAFYRTVADFDSIRSLVVKGVCDYADTHKDDTYRHYASEVSARYALQFIKEYVNSEFMPRASFHS
jgi:nucleoside phosphorylase